MDKQCMTKRDMIVTGVIALVVTVMYIACIPFGFITWQPLDFQEWLIRSCLNMALCTAVIFTALKIFKVDLHMRITKDGLSAGLKSTALPFVLYLVFLLISSVINYLPFTNTPSAAKLIVYCVIFSLLTAVTEELILRGMVLNVTFDILKSSKHRYLFAIIISSALFAAPHIFSVIGEGFVVCLFRFIYPFGFGMFMGYLYRKTDNLLVPVIYHFITDMAGAIPECFSGAEWTAYKPAFMIICSAVSIIVSVICAVKAVQMEAVMHYERKE